MDGVSVAKSVFERIPGLVLLTGSVQAAKIDTGTIAAYLSSSWAGLGKKIGSEGPKAHPLIGMWREALRIAGVPVKDCPPSIEAIAKRAAKGGAPFSVNPIVDMYNALSMELVLPFGAYDRGNMNGPLCLRLSDGGEAFHAIGAKQAEATVPGEVVYADDSEILTRHFLWRQSEKAKITDQTKDFIFVCELLTEMGEKVIEDAQTLIQARFLELLGAKVEDLRIVSQNAG